MGGPFKALNQQHMSNSPACLPAWLFEGLQEGYVNYCTPLT
jgi:hypothetical protein